MRFRARSRLVVYQPDLSNQISALALAHLPDFVRGSRGVPVFCATAGTIIMAARAKMPMGTNNAKKSFFKITPYRNCDEAGARVQAVRKITLKYNATISRLLRKSIVRAFSGATAALESMIRKSGNRFSEKDHAQTRR